MSDAPELLPCPFCGSEAEFIASGLKFGYSRVACTKCYAEMEDFPKVSAIEAWNARVENNK